MKRADKTEKFIQEMLKGKSQRKAYREAFPVAKRWKDKTVDEHASRLYHTPEVQQRLQRLLQETLEKAQKDSIMEAGELMTSLTNIARASVSDVLVIKETRNGTKISVKKGADLSNVQEIYTDTRGNIRVRMYSKMDALKTLAELLNLAGAAGDNEIRVQIDCEEYTK